METLPSTSFDDGVRFPSLEEDIPLSESAIRARRALANQNKNAKPQKFKREAFLDSIAQVFEELGGAPRLIEWADQNYGDFATKLLGKTLTPAINQLAVNASGPVQIVCPIGRSALDDTPELTQDGKELPLKDVIHDSGT
jgi:hypothetical protein